MHYIITRVDKNEVHIIDIPFSKGYSTCVEIIEIRNLQQKRWHLNLHEYIETHVHSINT